MTAPAGSAPRVLAVSRATPARIDIRGKPVLTSIIRQRSTGPLVLGATGAEGNQTAVHTEHLLAFPVEHYDYWTDRFGVRRGAWPLAHWGENIVLRGLVEENLPIGTVLQVGPSAVLQVTSPRNPCFKLSWRLGQPDTVLADILRSGRTGFYLRVLVPGPVFDGDAVATALPARPTPSVADVARLMGGVDATPERVREVLATEGLGVQCAGMLRQRLIALLDQGRTRTHRWQGWRPFTVAAVTEAASGVRSFELQPVAGGPLAPYRAGQHVQTRLGDGAGRTLTRPWSLSDHADPPARYRITVKRGRPQGASTLLHDAVRIGSTVELRAPAGGFHLDRSSNHPTVLISAGIGLTPLLAMLHAYVALGPGAPPVHWIHVTRNSATYAHRNEVGALLRAAPNALRHVRFTAPLPIDQPGADHDATGRLTSDELRRVIATYRYPIFGREVELPGAAAEFYLCGPAAFEAGVRAMLAALGAAPGAIRSESFGTGGTACGEATRVRFARSGVELEWTPGSSLLDAAEEAGIAAAHDCRAGACHQCAVAVLAGDVAYDREPAMAPPPGLALVCCGRPAGPGLVLDL